jgi:hypothetical protein
MHGSMVRAAERLTSSNHLVALRRNGIVPPLLQLSLRGQAGSRGLLHLPA